MTVERDTLRRRTWAEETVSLFPRYDDPVWRKRRKERKGGQGIQIAILTRAYPDLLSLTNDEEFIAEEIQETQEKATTRRMGRVLEILTTGGRDIKIPHNKAENLRILEMLILSSMKSDIGVLRRSPTGLVRPDILVMRYQSKRQTAYINQIGEVKLSISGRIKKVKAQKAGFLSALPEFIEEVNKRLPRITHGFLIRPPIRKIRLARYPVTFYVLPREIKFPPEIQKTARVYRSPFTFAEIRVLTSLIEKGLESE